MISPPDSVIRAISRNMDLFAPHYDIMAFLVKLLFNYYFMNSSHYPSLELCKKLTEIGFPISEKFWQYWKICDAFHDCMIHSEASVCPSVMEVLDVMPTIWWDTPKIVKNYLWWYVAYEWENHEIIWAWWNKWQCDNLPNALAEMILWLHENNYISFSK